MFVKNVSIPNCCISNSEKVFRSNRHHILCRYWSSLTQLPEHLTAIRANRASLMGQSDFSCHLHAQATLNIQYKSNKHKTNRRLSANQISTIEWYFTWQWMLLDTPKTIVNCIAVVPYLWAIFILLYAFFWVTPRRLNFICQCFGILCLFHLHRKVGMKNNWGIYMGKGLARK